MSESGGNPSSGKKFPRPQSVPLPPRTGWMKPTPDVELLIQKHFAGGDPVADRQPDQLIANRINRLARRPLCDLSQERPCRQAMENWGTWMSVKSNNHVCHSRIPPRPASTPGLVLTHPEKFVFDASQVKRRRKGRRFKGI